MIKIEVLKNYDDSKDRYYMISGKVENLIDWIKRG